MNDATNRTSSNRDAGDSPQLRREVMVFTPRVVAVDGENRLQGLRPECHPGPVLGVGGVVGTGWPV